MEPIPGLFPDEEIVAAADGVGHELSGKQLKIHEVLDSMHIDRANFDKTFISDVVELLRGGAEKEQHDFAEHQLSGTP